LTALHLDLPQARTLAVGATAVGGDRQRNAKTVRATAPIPWSAMEPRAPFVSPCTPR
jgi:hypothetical protein